MANVVSGIGFPKLAVDKESELVTHMEVGIESRYLQEASCNLSP